MSAKRIAALFAATSLVAFGTVTTIDESSAPPSCKKSEKVVVVDLDDKKHIHVLDHAWDAIGEGHPYILTIDRDAAEQHRRESLRGIPTRKGFDRDEYPPAMSTEGGKGADVRYVESRENRSAGSLMVRQLRGYCDSQQFVYESRNGEGYG